MKQVTLHRSLRGDWKACYGQVRQRLHFDRRKGAIWLGYDRINKARIV
jgi:hypothetical protein